MNNEGAFPRLVDLIASPNSDAEPSLDRLFMELLYEMARVEQINIDDLSMSRHSALPQAQTEDGAMHFIGADPSPAQYMLTTLSYDTYFRS
jgi:hypothetical protein